MTACAKLGFVRIGTLRKALSKFVDECKVDAVLKPGTRGKGYNTEQGTARTDSPTNTLSNCGGGA
ncbi:hypothetical protein GCM10009837_12450 [Streptomyces durmitorensis]